MNNSKKHLRELALRVQEISALPIQSKRYLQWKSLNDLKMIKPMIYTRDYSWDMVTNGDELTTLLEDDYYRELELRLLRIIFIWENFKIDNIVEPVFYCPVMIDNLTPIKYKVATSIRQGTEHTSRRNIVTKTAKKYIRQIFSEDDIDRVIPMPTIIHDKDDSSYERISEIFEGILEVRKKGLVRFSFCPWDDLLKLFGIEEGMLDFYLNPDLMHMAMKRYVDVYMETLRQYENAGIIHNNNGNELVGTGGLGYNSDFTEKPYYGIKANQSWGFCADQILTAVSPKLQEEFAIGHEIRWMEKFGLTYYGCCECLDNKINLLKKFKNLRKISVSPFSNMEKTMEMIGKNYVVSLKPNPAILAGENWDMEVSRKEIVNACMLAGKYGCNIEIIMKTMITLNNQPMRLRHWCRMASEITGNI